MLEIAENSTMAVDGAVPITKIKLLSADFDRRWLVGKLLSSRFDRRVDLENRLKIRRSAPLSLSRKCMNEMYEWRKSKKSNSRDEVGSRRMMARQDRYDQGNRSPYQTLESSRNSPRNP